MGIQEFLVILLVVAALFFLIRKYFFQAAHDKSACDHCDVKGIAKSKRKIKA